MSATAVVRRRGLLIIGRAILSGRERRGNRNESDRDKVGVSGAAIVTLWPEGS